LVTVSIFILRSVLKEVEQRERLAELSRAKSEFMSIASHQLRTPLSVMKGYLSMMQEGSFGQVTDKQKEVVKKVYSTNEEMTHMVNDLLNVTRAEEGRLQYTFERVDVRDLAEAITRGLGMTARVKNLLLTAELPADPVFLNADKDKLGQIISNLVDNAIKYTEQGNIIVRLSLPEPGTALITVKDTGLGIGEEEMKHLFESFSRGKAGTKSWTKGAGLGLYIAKQFVGAHKGKIWAKSEGEGRGSTFFVELPTA
jgi:signal transduction histidine kinase